jgi:hypothetical protein
MMKRKHWILLLVGCGVIGGLSTVARADEVAGQQADTPISIRIIDSPIRLVAVSPPTFGTYPVSDEEQVLQAKSGLTIKVADYRDERSTPWRLTYQLSTFMNGKAYVVKMNLGKGQLTSATVGEAVKFQASQLSLESMEESELVNVYSSKTIDYEYEVDKEAVSLTIPGKLPVGEFVGQQTVRLLNTPVVN